VFGTEQEVYQFFFCITPLSDNIYFQPIKYVLTTIFGEWYAAF